MKLKIAQNLAILAILMLVPVYANAQDLGSTSGIFKPKSAAKKKSTKPKKKTTRRKTAKKKTTRKKTTKSSAKSSSKRSKKKTNARRNRSKSSARKRSGSRKRSTKSASKKKSVEITKSTPSAVAADSNNGAGSSAVRKRVAEDVVITIGDPNNSSNEANESTISESFEEAILRGNSSRNRRLYDEAEKAYSLAKQIQPEDSRAIYGLGNVYSDQQRWESAETAYRKAIEMEPDSSVAKIALSFVLTQPVRGMTVSDRYVEAEKLARASIEIDPESALAYDQLGVALEMRGLITGEAESSYRKAISLDPTFALAHAHLGRLLRKQGRALESSKAYREAIQLAVNVPSMILVADVLQSQQRFLDSEQLLRKALRRDERNPTALNLLGRALTIRRSFDEAESILSKAVEISPKSFESHKLLGSMYTTSGDLLDAEQSYLMAMTVASKSEKVFLSRAFEKVGDRFLKVGKQKDAERAFRRALMLDESNQSVTNKLRKSGSALPVSGLN